VITGRTDTVQCSPGTYFHGYYLPKLKAETVWMHHVLQGLHNSTYLCCDTRHNFLLTHSLNNSSGYPAMPCI